jgi:hypothetical protein
MVRRQSSRVSSRIDLAEFLDHPRDHVAIDLVIRDIELERLGVAALGGDFRGDLLQSIGVTLQQDDLRALPGHLQRDRAAQSLAGAADNANLIRQQIHSVTQGRGVFRYSGLCS